jgi:hypothetical protein
MKRIFSLLLLFPYALNAMEQKQSNNFIMQTTLTYTTPSSSGAALARTLTKELTLNDLQNNTPPTVVTAEENPTYNVQKTLNLTECDMDKIVVLVAVSKFDKSAKATASILLPLRSKLTTSYPSGLKDAAGKDVMVKILSGPSTKFNADDLTSMFQ